MALDLYDLKEIKKGDRVQSAYLKGYFRVEDIKNSYRDGLYKRNLLILKKSIFIKYEILIFNRKVSCCMVSKIR